MTTNLEKFMQELKERQLIAPSDGKAPKPLLTKPSSVESPLNRTSALADSAMVDPLAVASEAAKMNLPVLEQLKAKYNRLFKVTLVLNKELEELGAQLDEALASAQSFVNPGPPGEGGV